MSNNLTETNLSENIKMYSAGVESHETKLIGLLINKILTKAPFEEIIDLLARYYDYSKEEIIECLSQLDIKKE